ncbi:hypothetical protein [Magnetofaba australis]|nr:hypothetical protein [Magnetofaba australis]
MKSIDLDHGDFETLVDALREQGRLGPASNDEGMIVRIADHPHHGRVILKMDSNIGRGKMLITEKSLA